MHVCMYACVHRPHTWVSRDDDLGEGVLDQQRLENLLQGLERVEQVGDDDQREGHPSIRLAVTSYSRGRTWLYVCV